MEARVTVELLGGLRVSCGEQTLTRFETRKTGVLLAYLAFYLDRAHPRETLAEQLWPDEDPDATRTRLRQALAALRRALTTLGLASDRLLIADRTEVRLCPGGVETDVGEFQACRRAAAAVDGDEQLRLLARAAELYRGELLPGCYEEWIVAERERLADADRDVLSRLSAALATAGDLAGAIDCARRAVATDLLREELHRDLMRLYAAAGRLPEALRQYRELERVLQSELGADPSTATRELAETIRDTGVGPWALGVGTDEQRTTNDQRPTEQYPAPRPSTQGPAPKAQGPFPPAIPLEPVGGAVPLNSPFYIVRPADDQFRAAIARRDSIVLVKGPRQIGKTSLLARGLQQAREAGARWVLTDFQKLTAAQIESSETLFYMLAEAMAEQLELEVAPEAVWNARRGWNVNFERYLRREVLGKIGAPLIWGLDEVDRLFPYPFSAEVFGLFRSWHNERSLDPSAPWSQLTLAIAYATEAHLFITDLNQSPFNVGTRVALTDFTREQVADLNRRYGGPLQGESEIARCFALLGGHPYLVRRGLHEMATQGLDLAAMEAQAQQDEGLFGDHLHQMLLSLSQDVGLADIVRGVLRGGACPNSDSFYRLRSAGVIVGDSPQDVRPRCQLYAVYLRQHLG